MYAAHAKKQREETSQSQLKECLKLLNGAKSDNDKFAALLEVTHHVWAGAFIDGDRRTALEAVDHQLLARLISTSSSDLYKSIALSILAALSVEPAAIHFPEMKDFMCLVNDVISANSWYSSQAKPVSADLYRGICRDCEDIVFNISQTHGGADLLVESGTASLLLDYFSRCQHVPHVLSSMASVMRQQGDAIFLESADKLNDAIAMAVEKLGQVASLTEKSEYAKILTSLLTGFSMIEVSLRTDWVVPLASCLQKLLLVKLHPDDCETVLQLVAALVGVVGPEVLDPGVTGSFHMLKGVVARVSVEVYMMLDGIDIDNATERHSTLDRVYKLLCGAVQCAAGLGDDADPDSVIAVYKKLVDTRDTIIEFLYSVANQELMLPRNHSVVLISVRALAAMLTEITEEPTPNLLKLLPFFNLLCQPVEYADDVILEVKNATQAALENIKMMGIGSIQELGEEEEEEEEQDGKKEGGGGNEKEREKAESLSSEGHSRGATAGANNNLDAFGDLSLGANKSNYSNSPRGSKKRGDSSISSTQTSKVAGHPMVNGDAGDISGDTSLPSEGKSKGSPHPHPKPLRGISLSKENVGEFKAFQDGVTSARSQPVPHTPRKASFSSRGGKKHAFRSIQAAPGRDPTPPWTPGPDDVLGYLLPAYMFLLDNAEALTIMADSDSFLVVVNFLQRALSNLLEGKVSVYPEVMTTNALSLIEQVHANSPDTAAKLHCFQDLFEIFMLSVPNLVNLPSPPPYVCLKVVETSLAAYKLQMTGSKKNTTLTRIKHSQTRFFKAVVEYLKSAYEIRPHKKRPPSLNIVKDFRGIWSSLEETWTSCLIGLSYLVTSVEELQDVMVKSSTLAEFLAFLRNSEAPSLEGLPEEASMIVEALLPLLEKSAEASDHICEMVLYNKGLEIARKFNLRKLGKHLIRFQKKTAS